MRTSLLFAFVSALVASVQSQGINVILEIQAANLYRNASVVTGPRNVFNEGPCDADSNRATPTAALVDASERLGFAVQHCFEEAINDYIITDIENSQESDIHHWNIYVNGALVTNGGCHAALNSGDHVRFSLEVLAI